MQPVANSAANVLANSAGQQGMGGRRAAQTQREGCCGRHSVPGRKKAAHGRRNLMRSVIVSPSSCWLR